MLLKDTPAPTHRSPKGREGTPTLLKAPARPLTMDNAGFPNTPERKIVRTAIGLTCSGATNALQKWEHAVLMLTTRDR